MKKMMIFLSFIFLGFSSNAQADRNAVNYFRNNYSSLNLEYYVFFEYELIEVMTDTAYRAKLERTFKQQVERTKGNLGIAKERRIFLHVLYNRIYQTDVNNNNSIDSKNYLLSKLATFKKLDFSVDEKFLEERLNPKKRGMPFGDEECDFDYSLFTFFLYDAKQYMNVIENNKIANPSGKILFPIKCFLEELSQLPLELKKKVQSQMLNSFSRLKGSNFDLLRKKIQNADLNAHYD